MEFEWDERKRVMARATVPDHKRQEGVAR